MSCNRLEETKLGRGALYNYLSALVNKLFKILPLREEKESTTDIYIQTLQAELIGFSGLIEAVKCDASFVTLLSKLQYLSDNPDLPIETVKREVFNSISLCYLLRRRYSEEVIKE